MLWVQKQKAPNIKDVPPGEEGWWLVDTNGKRVLSEMTGMPRPDHSFPDYELVDARIYHPEKLRPDGQLK